MGNILLSELLTFCGFPTEGRAIKVARHQDDKILVDDLYRMGEFEVYQSYQRQRWYSDCQYLISCIGMPGSLARIVGVYEVGAPEAHAPIPTGLSPEHARLYDGNHWRYPLTMLAGPEYQRLQSLYGRAVIRFRGRFVSFLWPDAAVIELLPEGSAEAFPGFLNVRLPFSRLQQLGRVNK